MDPDYVLWAQGRLSRTEEVLEESNSERGESENEMVTITT